MISSVGNEPAVVAVTDMKMHVCSTDSYVQLCYRRPQFGLALSWLAVHEAAFYGEHIIRSEEHTSELQSH